MSDSGQSVNKRGEMTRLSSTSLETNGSFFSFQAFLDDVPFQFNPKYRTIHVANVDVDEYETNSIRELLSQEIDFTLENRVLVEALEDLKRKKKEIETDTVHQPAPAAVKPVVVPPPSFRLPSVRDIYWPTGNLPVPAVPLPALPPPMHSSQFTRLQSPPSTNRTTTTTSDLTETFDDRLTTDDPFHDAELRSLNDVTELNHLYSAAGSANTIRR